MSKAPCSFPVALLLLYIGSLTLTACAPTTAGPSAALRQQFAQIKQQQQRQAEQLDQLQQQLASLQQQLSPTSESVAAKQKPLSLNPLRHKTEQDKISAAMTAKAPSPADSAANYLAAFSNLAAGRYRIAEAGFDAFLHKFPQHQYSNNARYWLAHAQLSQGKLQAAASNLRQVIVDQTADRAPAALALLARIYQQQQATAEAEAVLEQLRQRYPNSKEAQQLFNTAVKEL